MVDRDESKVRTFTGNEAKQKVLRCSADRARIECSSIPHSPTTRTIFFFLLFVAYYNTNYNGLMLQPIIISLCSLYHFIMILRRESVYAPAHRHHAGMYTMRACVARASVQNPRNTPRCLGFAPSACVQVQVEFLFFLDFFLSLSNNSSLIYVSNEYECYFFFVINTQFAIFFFCILYIHTNNIFFLTRCDFLTICISFGFFSFYSPPLVYWFYLKKKKLP